MAPLVVGPAIGELTGAQAGHARLQLLGRDVLLGAGARRRRLRVARRLSHRSLRAPARAGVEHSALRVLRVRRRASPPTSTCCCSSARPPTSACSSSSWRRWRGSPSSSPTPKQRESRARLHAGVFVDRRPPGDRRVLHRRDLRTIAARDRRRPCAVALHADLRRHSGAAADHHPAVPAGIAGVAAEESRRHVAASESIAALFTPELRRTTIVTTLMFAFAYGAAFGAIQQMPRIVPGLSRSARRCRRTQMQQTVSRRAVVPGIRRARRTLRCSRVSRSASCRAGS